MKIEDKRLSEQCLFHELMQGEVFINCYETIFMKTNEVEAKIDSKDTACPYLTFNAVFLESGELAHFVDEEEVRTINARLVIK